MDPKTTAPHPIVPNGRDGPPGGPKPQALKAPHPPSAIARRAAPAFTLLEVLVASAIMGIVMFVLVSTANTSLQLWRGTSEKMAVDRDGRSGLALLAWDLQNVIQPSNVALRPWVNTNLFAGGSASFPVLRFLTLKPSDYQTNSADLGDVCYVEYRYSNYAITRAFVGSALTFASLTNPTPGFPTNAATNFETLITNVWSSKFWGLASSDVQINYSPTTGQQTSTAQINRSIEYRIGVLDQKYMKIHKANPGSLPARTLDSALRWYQAMQPVPPPAL